CRAQHRCKPAQVGAAACAPSGASADALRRRGGTRPSWRSDAADARCARAARGCSAGLWETERALANNMIEEVPAGAILDLHDPDIGIELHLTREIRLHIRRWRGLNLHALHEGALGRARLIELRLRRGAIKIRSPVQPVDLDEDRARFLGAAAAQNCG